MVGRAFLPILPRVFERLAEFCPNVRPRIWLFCATGWVEINKHARLTLHQQVRSITKVNDGSGAAKDLAALNRRRQRARHTGNSRHGYQRGVRIDGFRNVERGTVES